MMEFLRNWGKTEHERVNAWLSAYLDGELTPQQRERVERHLSTCASCQHELETLRQTAHLLRQMPPLKIPRSFILTSAQVAPRPTRAKMRYSYLRGATAVATMLFLFVIAGDFLWQSARFSGSAVPEVAQIAVEQEVADENLMVAEAPRAAVPEPTSEVELQKEVISEMAPAPEQMPGIAEQPMAEEAPMLSGAAQAPAAQMRAADVDTAVAEDVATFGSVTEREVVAESAAPPPEDTSAAVAEVDRGKGAPVPTAAPPTPKQLTPKVGKIAEIVPTITPPLSYSTPPHPPITTRAASPFRLTRWRVAEIGLGLAVILLLTATLAARARTEQENL